MANEKISPENLYDFLDKTHKKNNDKQVQQSHNKYRKQRIISWFFTYAKLFLIIGFVCGLFYYKHSNVSLEQNIHNIRAYFDDFSKDNKKLNKENKIRTQNNEMISIPNVEIKGFLEKENGKFVVFKFNNKIYTLKEKDSFNDGEFVIEKIYMNAIDILDSRGNIHNVSI